ncbi:MAG: hypothetical protein JWN76_1292 [Chitinophagaceae bacterium]|nr:hypothetical protein [Chitinophagaceae bacterium]
MSLNTLHAQDTADKKNVFTAGINYQSRLHYFGRTDSLKSSGIFPSIGFQLKSGLYAQGTAVLYQNVLQPLTYTGSAIEAGYRFPQSEHFSGNIFATKFLYKDNSTLVQSALKEQAGVNLNFLNKVLNINTGADVKFSDKTDFGATAGVDHLFIMPFPETKSALAIDPTFNVYGGTQNFQNTYNRKRTVNGIPLGTETVTETATKFNILAYEASVPVVFVKGKFNISVTPSYVVPQNLIVVSGRPDLSERGEKMFYVNMGIGVRL